MSVMTKRLDFSFARGKIASFHPSIFQTCIAIDNLAKQILIKSINLSSRS